MANQLATLFNPYIVIFRRVYNYYTISKGVCTVTVRKKYCNQDVIGAQRLRGFI